MLRSIFALLIVFALLTSARADIPINAAGADKKSTQGPPADARQKIIAELQRDGDNATENLNDAETRAALARQQRIIDNITELLKQKNPDPPAGSSQNPPPKPKGSGEQKPNPMPNQENKEPQPKPANPESKAAPAQPQPAPETGKRGETAKSPESPQQETSKYGPWELPRHLPHGVDALARDRFIERYENLLRAYYNNLAETNRQKD